jgi:hypothetical protein
VRPNKRVCRLARRPRPLAAAAQAAHAKDATLVALQAELAAERAQAAKLRVELAAERAARGSAQAQARALTRALPGA